MLVKVVREELYLAAKLTAIPLAADGFAYNGQGNATSNNFGSATYCTITALIATLPNGLEGQR